MNDNLKEISKILLDGGYVEKAELEKAQKALAGSDLNLEQYLIENELLNKDLLGQALAEYYKLDYSDLNTHIPSKEQVLKIPETVAKKHRIVLFSDTKKELIIATDKPNSKLLRTALKKLFPKRRIRITFSLGSDIDEVFKNYRKSLATKFSKLIKSGKDNAPKVIDEIFSDATFLKASDIHFEPQKTKAKIRFRIDGVLRNVGDMPLDFYENIVNHIKVRSKLRIDEHSNSQDGSMQYQVNDLVYDTRISIVPIVEGEKIVIRILAQYVGGLTLINLGLNETDQKIFEEAIKKPFGMILVTGPTGSGKTTSLYGAIKILNKEDVNITTIEDPVEYKIKGVNQIQVDKERGLTFAKGLRSIVRQDPDIILVGEVRDKETAEISVNAALTGHLLFSTFHANNSTAAVPRLIDMGVEPFIIASTLELIIAQRLVRKICENCRQSVVLGKNEISKISPFATKMFGQKATLYKGKGCPSCNHTGYSGRTAVFEFLKVSQEIKDLIAIKATAGEIHTQAMKEGFLSMFDDGIEKVKQGVTTLEELIRVVAPGEQIKSRGKKEKKKTKKAK